MGVEVENATLEGLVLEAQNLTDDATVKTLLPVVLRSYLTLVEAIGQDTSQSLQFDDLVSTGKVCDVQHMDFWGSVVRKEHENHLFLQMAVPLAAMMLALPAAEAIDETVFSRTGRTLTKSRTALTDPNVERITVIRMYVESHSLSVEKLNSWVKQAIALAAKTGKKKR